MKPPAWAGVSPYILLQSDHRLLLMFTLPWSLVLTQMIPRLLAKDGV